MSECKVTVDPGVCKLGTVIVAKPSEDMMSVVFEVETSCPNIRKMADKVGAVNAYEAMGMKMCENPVYVAANECCPHAACPVPCAFIKAMEVAADLGLKKDVSFKIERSQTSSPSIEGRLFLSHPVVMCQCIQVVIGGHGRYAASRGYYAESAVGTGTGFCNNVRRGPGEEGTYRVHASDEHGPSADTFHRMSHSGSFFDGECVRTCRDHAVEDLICLSADVQGLFLGGLAIRRGAIIVLLFSMVALVLMKADWKRLIPQMYQRVLAVFLALTAVAGFLFSRDFNKYFVIFHHIFFNNNLWILDPAEDYMIRMLPEGFFYDMVMRIGSIFAVFLIVSFVCSIVQKKINKRCDSR